MGKNRKPLFVLSVVMVIGMVMGSVSSGLAADKPRIAIVFATGGLGDKSFNDSAYEGMLRAEKELGIEFDQAEPQAVAEYESLLMRFAQTRRYDLIISIGFDQADALQVVSGRFPDQKFAIVDTAVDAPNVASYVYREAERGFVVGAVAGLMTKRAEDPRIVPDKQIIGVIGGMDIPLIRANVAGYIAGAKFANPEVEVKYSYVGDWADPAKCKEMANAMLDEGVDVIWLAAGRSGLGGIMAAEERNRFAIGADVDQGYLAPDHILTNGMKLVDNTVFMAIEAVLKDEFTPGTNMLGLKEGALGYSHNLIPADIIEEVDKLAERVASGELTVPEEIDQVDAWLKAQGK
ncbi:MAG: BMP family ABC transporter substrate-binding protein [Bacillota bacterium]|jgi:basic membrane protein A|nr:BMP family ABC transporter substrate-binding protein [Bacillota bacterium]MDI9415501.1 BMP family ABC transporter substrate-binding protein [Bacillota bacterium]NLD12518.1 BMP family ABC transporter substrate-binding protein [Bacillota bacterium]HOB89461.1 BMP family ABC transporter substrate-binding protein [Bacillota bacterium]HOJ58431.1 BMP family ABC transporter substrate-binding protein [Bacillota bacterium]